MAKTISYDNIAHARAFIAKFGFGEENVTIDEFDMFIIDRGLAQDPGTSDTKDNAYRGFVQKRSAARRLLNTAGTWINGSSFQIVVNKEVKKNYSVVKWATDSNEFSKNVGKQVGTYVKSRIANMESLRSKAKALVETHGEDDQLHDSIVLLSEMSGHGISMQAKIAGLIKQYDTAYAAVVAKLEDAMQKRLGDDDEVVA